MSDSATEMHSGERLMMLVVAVCALTLPLSFYEAGWAPRSGALLFVCVLSLACGVLIGPLRLARLVRWPLVAAAAQGGAPQTPSLAHVLNQMARLLRAGSNLVMITPSSDPAWMQALAQLMWRQITPVVILIDPAPEGRPILGHVAASLAEQGVACRSVRCDVPLKVRPALGRTRRWEFKTLATGRVIATMESVR